MASWHRLRDGSHTSVCWTEARWVALQGARGLLYKSAEKNPTPDKRKRLYSEVFGSTVRKPRSRAEGDDFYDVTPNLGKAVSCDPSSMPVELLRNKCIVILATLQPHLFTFQNCFYVRFHDKVGKWKNHSVTGREPFWPNISNVCAHTPAFLLSGKSRMLERLWVLSTLQKWP